MVKLEEIQSAFSVFAKLLAEYNVQENEEAYMVLDDDNSDPAYGYLEGCSIRVAHKGDEVEYVKMDTKELLRF